jgi:hypothetical protein
MPSTTIREKEVMSGQELEVPAVHGITAIDTMDLNEYMGWLSAENIEIQEFTSSEWELVGNKDELIGKRFIIARTRFNEGKMGDFVSVMAFTVPNTTDEAPKKIVFNDGSTGVYKQLKDYVATHDQDTAINCPKGLRVSRYTTDDGIEAATYYIA